MIVCCGWRLRLFLFRPQDRVFMPVQPQPWPEAPAETARVAKAAFRRGGSLAIRIGSSTWPPPPPST